MNKPSIIVTGANGFIGERLVSYFAMQGWHVKALVHRVPDMEFQGVSYRMYDLQKDLAEKDFEDVDFLIHAAYVRFDKNKNADAINVSGSKKLIEQCRKNNIRPLFLSSFSAHAEAASHYGKTKLECEKLFDPDKDVVLRAGFVIGEKGLSAEIARTISKASFFPLVGGGIQPIQTIHINDLCLVIEKIFENELKGIFNIAEPEAISMRTFYEAIAKQMNVTIRFVSVPLQLLFIVCRIAEAIGIRLRVSSESVLGLKHLVKFETNEDLKRVGVSIRNYRQSLESVLK